MRAERLCQAKFLQLANAVSDVFAGNYGCLCMGPRAALNLCVLCYVPHAMTMTKQARDERDVRAFVVPGLKGETGGTRIFSFWDRGHPPTASSRSIPKIFPPAVCLVSKSLSPPMDALRAPSISSPAICQFPKPGAQKVRSQASTMSPRVRLLDFNTDFRQDRSSLLAWRETGQVHKAIPGWWSSARLFIHNVN